MPQPSPTLIHLQPGSATYDYRGFRVTFEHNRYQRIARIYRHGELVSWFPTLESAIEWIDAKAN